MADTPGKSDDSTDEVMEITLESPSTLIDVSNGTGAELFSADSMALVTSKLHIAENYLRLAAKDQKFNDFTRELLMTTMQAIKSEAGSLFEFDAVRNSLFIRAAVGTSSDKISSFTIPVGSGVVGYVAESRQPISVSDAAANDIHLKSIDEAVGFRTKNLIAAPILVRGQLYGVIELLNRVGESSYTNQDLELMAYCTEMAAKALEIRFMVAWAIHRKGQAA